LSALEVRFQNSALAKHSRYLQILSQLNLSWLTSRFDLSPHAQETARKQELFHGSEPSARTAKSKNNFGQLHIPSPISLRPLPGLNA
jgi:hypothetical protein